MPQSLSAVYLHLVFSTKSREPWLADAALRAEMHAFLGGVSRQLDFPTVIVGGVAYIRNQEEHHRKMTFQDEFRKFLRKHRVEWDERHVWD